MSRALARVFPPAASWARSMRRSSNAGADRAAHPSAAQPAIAHRILGEILLVVVLGKVERRRVEDLGGDRVKAARLERLLVHRLGGFGHRALGDIEHVDAGTVL